MRIFVLALLAMVLTACDSDSEDSSTPSAVSNLSVSFSAIKSFDFTWTDASDATYYKLMENEDGSSGFTQVGSNISLGSQAYSHIVPLYARMNSQYILQSCNNAGCTDSSTISINNSLVDSIGYVKASNADAHDAFGSSLAISEDGTTLAVGAIYESSNATGIDGDQADVSTSNSGAAYIFTYDSGSWSQQAYVKASNTDSEDTFGFDLSLSSDGDTLAISAPGEDSNATGVNGNVSDNNLSNSGAVYIFTRNTSSQWSQHSYLKASNTESGDKFGTSLSISSDGSTLVVGAPYEKSNAIGIDGDDSDNSADDAGASYIFTKSSGGIWSQQAYIKASNTETLNYFGQSVSISEDGNTLAVGAQGEGSSSTGINNSQTQSSFDYDNGAAYIFTRTGSTWTQQAYVKASNTANDFFGYRLTLSKDGDTLAVAAPHEKSSTTGIDGDQTDNSLTYAGAVYIYTRSSSTWTQEAYLKASNTGAYDQFGYSLYLSENGNILAVGAHHEESSASGIDQSQTDNSAENSGAVYVFTRSNSTWNQQAYLKASNTDSDDEFGKFIALSADGKSLAVGAIKESSNSTEINGDQTNNSSTESGAVYLY